MRARMTLRLICVICTLIVLFAPTSPAISAQAKPDNYPPVLFLGTKSPPPMCSSNFDPTLQTLTNYPGVPCFAGDASVAKFSSTDVFDGIFFNAFKIDSQPTRTLIGSGRSGRNWGKLSFHTQFSGHRRVYERLRISANKYVGIEIRTLGAKLEAAGGDIIGDRNIYSRGRPIKDGLSGQGCGHFQLQSQGRDTPAIGRHYATAMTSTQDADTSPCLQIRVR